MKTTFLIFIAAIIFFNSGCSDVDPNAVDLEVDFSWEGMTRCGMGIPDVVIKEVPENTKYFVVRMYDHAYLWDHGEVRVAYNGSNIISKAALEKIESPCPPDTPGRYEVTVKALDETEAVIGVGSKERYFPENK